MEKSKGDGGVPTGWADNGAATGGCQHRLRSVATQAGSTEFSCPPLCSRHRRDRCCMAAGFSGWAEGISTPHEPRRFLREQRAESIAASEGKLLHGAPCPHTPSGDQRRSPWPPDRRACGVCARPGPVTTQILRETRVIAASQNSVLYKDS